MGLANQKGGLISAPYPAQFKGKPNTTVTAATFVVGHTVKYSADEVVAETASVTDNILGIIHEFSNYKDLDTLATTSDKVISYMVPQYQPIYVFSESAGAYTQGALVYMAQTSDTNGHVDSDSSSSATTVGRFYWNNKGELKDFTVGATDDIIGIIFTGE